MKKKILSALFAGMMFMGCSSGSVNHDVEVKDLSILAPQGAPALSLIPITDDEVSITTVDGSDPLQAAFVNPNPEYDVIIAPTNLGVKLAQADKTTYRLLAIVDWGNLYIVGEEGALDHPENTIAAFGEQNVPGLVFSSAYRDLDLNITWYGSAQEAMAALLSHKADCALLAEPAATAAIAKAKENDQNLMVLDSVQKKWGDEGFPMAGMFVRSDTYEENKAVYDSMLDQMNTYAINTSDDTENSTLIEDMERMGSEFYGVPSAQIIRQCYSRMNIRITKVSECKEEIAAFLKLFGVDAIDQAIIE